MLSIRIFLAGAALFVIPAVSFAQQETQPSSRFGAIRWAAKFSGASPTEQINAAIKDCGDYTGATDKSCLVLIPSGMGCGEPNQAPDHVMLWDLRGCAQSQGLRFNVPRSASGHVRSKVLLQDNFAIQPAPAPPPVSSATLYVYSLPDSANRTTGTVAAINGTINTNSLTGDFNGNLIGIEGEAEAALAEGGPFTVRDMRGGTFNTVVGRGINAISVTSLFAQAPLKTAGGEIVDAFSLRAEAPKVGTKTNLAGWFNGDVKVDTKLAVGESLRVGGGPPIHQILLSHKNLEFGEIRAQDCTDQTVPVHDASPAGTASASPAAGLQSDKFLWSARVSAIGIVSVRICNVGGSIAKPATVDWNVSVIQ